MLPVILLAGCAGGFGGLDPDTAALRDAAALGDTQGVDSALARAGDVRSLYVLQGAAINGHAAMIRHLVARGAPVEAPDGWNSHLWFAVVNGQTDAVRTLLELGADPDRASPPEGGPPRPWPPTWRRSTASSSDSRRRSAVVSSEPPRELTLLI